MFRLYASRSISFSFREGKCPYYNALSSKKIIWSVTDTILDVKVCLKIPIAKRIGAVVLVVYIILYDRKNVVY